MHLAEMKGRGRPKPGEAFLLIAVSILIGTGMWYYFDRVGVAAQEAGYARLKSGPSGNLSDLYPPWLGSRELLLHKRNPYSPEITTEIQTGFWGYPGDPRDEARFFYPLFVVFLLAPSVTLPFQSVQALYAAIAVVLSVASVWFWFRIFGERHSFLMRVVASLLLLGSYPVVQALHNQQLVLLVAALIASAMAATAAGMFWTAGMMLALAMIKPQVTLPIAGWLLLWAVSKWRERRVLVFSFAATTGVLVAGAEFLLPGWIWKWRGGLSDYVQYTPLPPPQVQLLFGKYIGAAAGAGLVLALAVLCWRTRRDPSSSDRFQLAPPLILAATLAATPIWHGYDQMLLLPAVLLGFQWRDEFFRLKPFERAFVMFSLFVLAWSWFAAITLLLLNHVSSSLAQELAIAPLYSIPFSPICTLVSLALISWQRLLHSGRLGPFADSCP